MLNAFSPQRPRRAAPRRSLTRGDTLIEVLFAVTVFSLVVVLSLSLMNQGTSASIRALQISLVRQEIDSQAETLRFLNSAYVEAFHAGYAPTSETTPAAEYYRMIENITTADISPFGGDKVTCPEAPNGSFLLNTRTAKFRSFSGNPGLKQPAEAFSQTVYNGDTLTAGQGVWIEAVRSTQKPAASNQSNTRYTDFHIRACWDAPGAGAPMNLGTIVRLYEPVNS